MKRFLALGLALLTVTTVFADPFEPGQRESVELNRCLRNLDDALRDARNARFDLEACRRNGTDPREVEELRREVQRLRYDNANLFRENQDLRIQIDQMKPQHREVFSYAACVTLDGVPDLRYVGTGIGGFIPEAEANAMASLKGQCSYSVVVIKSEEIFSTTNSSFCSVACTDLSKKPDLRYSASSAGRNMTEAAGLAFKKLKGQCSYNAAVVSCQ